MSQSPGNAVTWVAVGSGLVCGGPGMTVWTQGHQCLRLHGQGGGVGV